jgi:molybdate transport system substrate-binding protein
MTLSTRLLGLVLLAWTTTAAAAELIVSAAASLADAFREIATTYESTHPNDKVLLNFAASDALLAQIVKGAPADVLATADEASMDRAQRQRAVLAGTREDFTGNRLVLAVRANQPNTVASLRDLSSARVTRIAMGNPATVPAGRYARATLEQANLWDAIRPKLVFADNVRQALDYIARGEVDAGLVYSTDAAIAAPRVRAAIDVPTPTAIRYPAAVVASTQHEASARAFVRFLTEPAAQAILPRYGFVAVAAP